MLEDGGFVEPLDERAPVISGGDDAVVFELHKCLLYRDAAYSQAKRDLIAVDTVATAQLPSHYQVEDVVNNLVFFFDPIFLRHQSLSNPHLQSAEVVSHDLAPALRCFADELEANSKSRRSALVTPAAKRLGRREVVVRAVASDGQ